MTVPTVAEIALLRTAQHRTKLHLFLYTPSVVFSALTSGSPVAGDTTISYSNVSSGSYLDIKAGMTLYIGTSEGGHEVGRIRVRSATSSQLNVAENNDIQWASGLYITVGKFFEPWGVYPNIVLNSSNVPIFYKDGNVVYTNQNNILDPIPMMGPNMAGLIDPQTGQCRIYFDGANSYDLNDLGSISSYSWLFESAVTPTSSLATPGYVTWNEPGDYLVQLTVTNNQGKSITSYRIVMIRTQYGGTNSPIRNWGLTTLTGNYTSGGWNGRFWMRQSAGAKIVRPGALMIILAEDWYGNIKQSIGGNYPNRENLLFVGYVRDGSLEVDPVTSIVEFEVVNLSLKLDISEVFSVSLVSKVSATTWYEMKNMTVDKAIQHFIRWHTTLYQIADINKNGDTLPIQYSDFSREPLRGCLDNYITSTLLGKMITDRQGQVWFEKNVNIIEVDDRILNTSLNLVRKDWKDIVRIEQTRDAPTSYVELGGIAYAGPATDVFNAYISSAPGAAPKYTGQTSIVNGMVLETQNKTNQLVGNVLAMMNNEFRSVKIEFVGNYRIFDLAPQERIKATLQPSENNLQLHWDHKNIIPRSIQMQYDKARQLLIVTTDCEAETDGPPGITGPYPLVPPDDVVDFDTTPIEIPEPPEIPGPEETPADGNTVYVVTNSKIGRTRNFLSSPPNWQDVTGAVTGNILDFILDPWDPRNSAYVTTSTRVYHTVDLDADSPTWDVVLTSAQICSTLGIPTDINDFFYRILGNITQEGLIFGNFFSGFTFNQYGIKTTDAGLTWTATLVAPGAGNFNPTNMSAMAIGQHNGNVIFIASRAASHPFNSGIYSSLNGNASYSQKFDFSTGYIHDINIPYENNSLDQVVYLIYNSNSTNSILYRSLDGGSSWTDITPVGFSPVGGISTRNHPYMIHTYTGDRNIVAVSNSGSLWLSLDAGNTWSLKSTFGESYAFGGFPFNGGQFYRIENGVGPRVSFDEALTWTDKLGDWASVLGAFGTGVMIVPVWIDS